MRARSLPLTLLLLSAAPLTGQEIAPYVPVSPVLASRSPLYAQPFVAPRPGWQARVVVDYTNAIEKGIATDRRESLLDAELLQVDLWLVRDLSPTVFVLGNVAVRGGYDGHLDGFLNWYHEAIGLPVPARNERPENEFAWNAELPDGRTFSRERPGTLLGDARVGAGVRLGARTQLVGALVLPTATASQEDWGLGTIGTSVAFTTNLATTDRVAADAGLTVGTAAAKGELAAYQRTTFVGGMAALRWRFWGRQALYGTLFLQRSPWQDTGFAMWDDPEVTIDFGGFVNLGKGWPELQLGVTEDLLPRGPAVDVGFKIGARIR
jgi:hypothetical protein